MIQEKRKTVIGLMKHTSSSLSEKLSSKSLKINSVWNLLGSGAPIFLGAVTIPYLIQQVGVEMFGILTLVWALIGYFSLFDFGLGRALTQQIATKRAEGLVDQLPSLIKTGLLLTLVTGLIGCFLLAAAANQLGHKWLNVSVSLQEVTAYSLLIASLGIPLATLTSGLRGVLEADEDFKTVNLLRMFLGVANFGLPALSVMVFGPRLEFMVTSLIVARFTVLVGHAYFVNKTTSKYLHAGILGKQNVKELLSFGVWMTASNIISPLMVVADRFIISYLLGASLVAFYTVPFEVLIRVLIIPAALTAALFPRLASLGATDRQAANALYKKSLRTVMIVMSPVCIIIAAGSYWGLKVWLGQDFAINSWLIASILAIGIFLNSVAQIPHAVLHAQGRVRATAIIHLSEFVFYIPILFVSLSIFGLQGAAIIWVVRAGCDLAILLKFAKVKNI